MKKIAIVQSNYIPWLGYFDMINSVDEFVLFDDVQYTKRDWRNRNDIKTPNGKLRLTIPVQTKGSFYQKIKDTKISDINWNNNHWQTIKVNYKKSEFFNEISEFLEPLYLKNNFKYLSEINYNFIHSICSYLQISTKISNSNDYEIIEGKSERLASICAQSNSTVYISGNAAKSYLDEDLFNDNNIMVKWFEYKEYKEYNQLWGSFIQNLSIIDLLFNCGPHSKDFFR